MRKKYVEASNEYHSALDYLSRQECPGCGCEGKLILLDYDMFDEYRCTECNYVGSVEEDIMNQNYLFDELGEYFDFE